MNESERLLRWKENYNFDECGIFSEEKDEIIVNRIMALLDHPKIDKTCMVDAYYYDYSNIPDEIRKKINLSNDVYLIFGITIEGEIISKWVDRWDLDNDSPIIDGKVIHNEKKETERVNTPSIILQSFNANLLSTPIPDFFK